MPSDSTTTQGKLEALLVSFSALLNDRGNRGERRPTPGGSSPTPGGGSAAHPTTPGGVAGPSGHTSEHHFSAADVDRLAGDPAGRVRGEEQRRVGAVLRRAPPGDRELLGDLLPHLRRDALLLL